MNLEKLNIFDIGHYRNEDGPGIRTVVFLKGCPLSCVWCSNPFGLSVQKQLVFNNNKCINCGRCIEICKKGCNKFFADEIRIDYNTCNACGDCVVTCPANARSIVGETVSIDELYEMVIKETAFYRRTGGGVTLSGGEVLMQYKGAVAFLKKCRENSLLNTAIETSAYGCWEHLKLLTEYCNYVFVDLKHLDRVKHKQFVGVSNELILENIQKLCKMSAEKEDLKIIIRRPIIPGINDDDETTINIARFVNDLLGNPEINLLPYHNLGEAKYSMIGLDYNLSDVEMIDPKSDLLINIKDLTLRYAPDNRVSIGGGEIFAG